MSYLDSFDKIKAFVFDVDGVLTDGKVVLLPNGEQMLYMHSKDGYAIQLAVKKGYHVAAITGGNSTQVRDRLKGLGVTDTYLKSSHKDESMDDFMTIYGLSGDEIAYMGDDIPDLPALKMVGLSACPADASSEIRNYCSFVSKVNGGHGCVRDLIEQVMRHQQKWYDPEKNLDNFAEFTW